jgi:hypothetical protein
MKRTGIPTLGAITVLAVLSLLAAVVLFGILTSTGLFKNQFFEVGGAAAGFLATFWLLERAYRRMEEQRTASAESQLRAEVDQLRSEAASLQRDRERHLAAVEQLNEQAEATKEEQRGLEGTVTFLQDELARYAAMQFAIDCVKDQDNHEGLNTSYGDTWEQLRIYFRKLGDQWLQQVLLPEFKRAIILEVRKAEVPDLQTWRPSDAPEVDLVDDTTG